MNELTNLQIAQPIMQRRTLEDTLRKIGPMPQEALYIGMALDDIPVVLNLHDPVPGSLLISGDPGAGKTDLLRTIAAAVGLMHRRDAVQFGVITNGPEEWAGFEGISNNTGIFVGIQNLSQEFFSRNRNCHFP